MEIPSDDPQIIVLQSKIEVLRRGFIALIKKLEDSDLIEPEEIEDITDAMSGPFPACTNREHLSRCLTEETILELLPEVKLDFDIEDDRRRQAENDNRIPYLARAIASGEE